MTKFEKEEEERRKLALELATRLIIASEHSNHAELSGEAIADEVVKIAERFTGWLRRGN